MWIALGLSSMEALELPEDTYQILAQSLENLSSDIKIDPPKSCLSSDSLYQAAKANLESIETFIMNTMRSDYAEKDFMKPYFRLWVLGKLGPQFFDFNLPNNQIPEPIEIEKNMFLLGLNTKLEGGRVFWVPLLIDTKSLTISILNWEQCQGKCYALRTTGNTAYGICGKWNWNASTKTLVSLCQCGGRKDCGTQNTYTLEAGILVLKESLRKTKCDGWSFSRYAKLCCVE
ncbi:hypothetical protein [Candidatus Bealeia paramacronuclearis]